MTNVQRTTPANLRGMVAISYQRFSSSQQDEKHGGSSIERQVETRDRIVAHFGLSLDRTVEDRARSASKGHHRSRGNLGDLLAAANRGDFHERPTALIVEAIDRLFREGVLDVFPILRDLVVKGRLILITGDFTVWDEVSINSSNNHKLLAEINAAREYAQRLSQFSSGGHAKRRRLLTEVAAGERIVRPVLNGRTPGWLNRLGKPDAEGLWYALDPVHSRTVRRIFEECGSGATVRQIARGLNGDAVPLMHWATGLGRGEWTAARVGALLRDRHVIGFYTPTKYESGRRAGQAMQEVRVFPAAIDAPLWLNARRVLEGRQMLVGRRGGRVANLFTRRAFCSECGLPFRVDSGGRLQPDGTRKRTLVCSRWLENQKCQNRRRYDLSHFEVPLIGAIIQLTELAPRRAVDVSKLTVERAELLVEIKGRDESLAVMVPRAAQSPTLAGQIERLAVDTDEMRRRVSNLALQIEAAAATTSRAKDAWDFLRAAVRPALAGDTAARERLRNLIATTDYRIEGMAHGGMVVIAGGGRIEIDPPGFSDLHDEQQPESAVSADAPS